MKKVKLIYFPLVIFLALVLIIVSFVHVCAAGSTKDVSAAFLDGAVKKTETLSAKRQIDTVANDQDVSKSVREYILTELSNKSDKIFKATAKEHPIPDNDEETYYIAHFGNNETRQTQPAYYHQSELVRIETINAMASSFSDDTFYATAGRKVDNIVVLIPGSKTQSGEKGADAVLLTAHMDPSKKSPSSEDAPQLVMLAVMLEEIDNLLKNGYNGENDLVFLFTDGRYDRSVGLYAFLHQFNGFRKHAQDITDEESIANDLVKRIKFAANFDALGSGGASMLIGATSSCTISQYATMMGGSLSSSLASDVLKGYNSGFDALKDFGIESLNLITFGDLKNENNIAGSVLDLGTDHIRMLASKKASMLKSVIGYFSDADLSDINGSGTDGADTVYFSVLGMFTINLSKSVSYVLGAVLVLLIAAALFFSIRNKAFDIIAMVKGLFLQLLSIGAALASMFIVYFFSMLILSGFGAVMLEGIISFTYFNPGLIIGFLLFAVAMQGLFYNLFKKIFGIKATDTARGGVMLFLLVSLVLAFAYPSLGALLWFPAVLAALAMLLTSIFKEKFRLKTGQDIERMMFYLIPFAFTAALVLPTVCILFSLVPLVLAPIILLPLILAAGMVAPYLLALKPLMTRLFEKLPKRTIRVERMITENVEDKAKKGKFTEVTYKKVTKEKIHWRYRHSVAMAVIAVVSAVIIMISAGVSKPAGASVYGFENYGNDYYSSSLFDDSLVFSYIQSNGGTPETNLEIHDKALYAELRYDLEDYSWNSNRGAYTKNFTFTKLDTPGISGGSDRKIRVNPARNGTPLGLCEITLFDTSKVSEIKVSYKNSNKTLTIKNSEKKDNIFLRLPLNEDDFDDFDIEVVLQDKYFASAIDVLFRQYVWYPNSGFLSNKSDNSNDFALISKDVRCGMYFEITVNVPLT